MLTGTNYMPYHLNGVWFFLFVFVFNQVQIATVSRALSYLSLLKCCRKPVLVPACRIFNANHPLTVRT